MFNLQAPAGCLVTKRKEGVGSGTKCRPRQLVEALADCYGISGACFLLRPSAEDFYALLRQIADQIADNTERYKDDFYYEYFNSMTKCLRDDEFYSEFPQPRQYQGLKFNAGPDEQALTKFYFRDWTAISRQYCAIPWLVDEFEGGMHRLLCNGVF